MPRFSANIGFLFTELPVLERPAAAAAHGFGAVEMPFVDALDVGALAAAKEAAGIGFSVFNIPAGDLPHGGPGLAAMPGREAQFREAVASGVAYARDLAPRNVNVLAGWPPSDLDRAQCRKTLVENIRIAADAFAEVGVKVVVEAVNVRDRPGFFLSNSAETLAVIDDAGHANLAIEYDVYHMQIMEGDLLPTLEKLIDRIGHIQFADTPGRHEPGTGEINFANVFAAIDRLGYDGWVAAEYNPTGKTEDSLAWMAA